MKRQRRIVLVFGTFDFLHLGHLDFFRQAKRYGDRLVIVVARDKTVERVKGCRPIHSENTRLENVRRVFFIDRAILGRIRDPYDVIEEVKPDVICLGYDQKAFTENLQENLVRRHLSPRIIRLKPFHPEKYKSSRLRSTRYPS